jgi:hypothetical protein
VDGCPRHQPSPRHLEQPYPRLLKIRDFRAAESAVLSPTGS